jgi:hypothetical protein
MENIEKILDELETGEVDKLLQRSLRFHVDRGARKRIAATVFQKAGIRTRTWPGGLLKCTAAAAALLLIAALIVTVSGGSITAAIKKIFDFIPGVGIVENDPGKPLKNSIKYNVESLSSASSDDAALELQNAVATDDSITVSCNFSYKKLTKEQIIEKLNAMPPEPGPNVLLHLMRSSGVADPSGIKYEDFGSGGSERYQTDTFIFKVKPEDINTSTTYRIEYVDYRVSLDFKLQKIDSFENLDQIGATDTHNDISITAVAKENDGVLTVDVYPINKGNLQIYAFAQEPKERGYRGRDLHLETSRGRRDYRTPDQYAGPNTRFIFDVTAAEKGRVLKIPYLLVQTTESRNVVLPIPPIGKKVVVNQKVEFEDCTMIIVDVAKISEHNEPCLRMNLKYENKSPMKIMKEAQFHLTNFLGRPHGGGGYMSDENGVTSSIELGLDKSNGDTLRFSFSNPIYYLFGEYRLKLDQ